MTLLSFKLMSVKNFMIRAAQYLSIHYLTLYKKKYIVYLYKIPYYDILGHYDSLIILVKFLNAAFQFYATYFLYILTDSATIET